jgi:ribosomal-protein-alanine N-acetyltransferase
MPRRSRAGSTRSRTPSTTGQPTQTTSPSCSIPARRGDAYIAVEDEAVELIGYFCFKPAEPGTIVIGLGLRPDRTGCGLGGAFLQAGLDHARMHHRPKEFALAVATFNERTITVYERAGFDVVRTYMHHTNGGDWEFAEMRRPA